MPLPAVPGGGSTVMLGGGVATSVRLPNCGTASGTGPGATAAVLGTSVPRSLSSNAPREPLPARPSIAVPIVPAAPANMPAPRGTLMLGSVDASPPTPAAYSAMDMGAGAAGAVVGNSCGGSTAGTVPGGSSPVMSAAAAAGTPSGTMPDGAGGAVLVMLGPAAALACRACRGVGEATARSIAWSNSSGPVPPCAMCSDALLKFSAVIGAPACFTIAAMALYCVCGSSNTLATSAAPSRRRRCRTGQQDTSAAQTRGRRCWR